MFRMDTSVVEAHLPAPKTTVFRVLSDPDTYPKWLVGAKRIRGVSPGFPEEGSEFHHAVGGGPVEVKDKTEVADVDEPNRLTLDVHARPFFDGRVEFRLREGRTPDETHVQMCERPSGPFRVIAPLVRPALGLRNKESLRRLRAFLRNGGGAVG